MKDAAASQQQIEPHLHTQWQLFISQVRLIKHTVMRACAIPHWFVYNDRDSADYILRTTAQSEAAKVAEER